MWTRAPSATRNNKNNSRSEAALGGEVPGVEWVGGSDVDEGALRDPQHENCGTAGGCFCIPAKTQATNSLQSVQPIASLQSTAVLAVYCSAFPALLRSSKYSLASLQSFVPPPCTSGLSDKNNTGVVRQMAEITLSG